MSTTSLSFSAPDVALVAELNIDGTTVPLVLTVPDAPKVVQDSVLVSHNTYSTNATALAAAQALYPSYDGSALFGEIVFTDVNVSSGPFEYSVGDAVTINSEVSADAGVVAYQWYKDDQIIPGATSSSLSTASFEAAHVGRYACGISAPDASTARVGRTVHVFEVTETPPAPPALTSATAIGA